jgi:L-cysteine:1D-myo-inositol 2-amino-2-deoxy-alpha-D-glucopyranoside ligase
MIGLDGEKMSKSKGNLVFVSKLLSDGVDPMTIRIALLRDKYSHDRMWSNDLLLSAESLRARMIEALAQTHVVSTDLLRKEIISALSQGLNSEKVFHLLEEWLQHNIQAKADGRVESSGVIARFLDGLLGLTF